MIYFAGFGLSVEGEITAEVVSRATDLAYKLRSEADARGLLALRKYVEFSDGGYAHGLKHGEVVRIRVVNPPKVSEEPVTVGVPDFASGLMTQPIIWHDVDPFVMRGFYPTAETANRLELLHQEGNSMERFTVEIPYEWGQDTTGNARNRPSQYSFLKPSMYSGSMKKLVQALMGFGKPGSSFANVLPAGAGDTSTAWTQWEARVFSSGLPILYDYGFYKTNGLVRGADNKWYVVEISPRGVLAMPLTFFRYTDTPEFRERMEELGHEEAVEYLETFGGFPTGETIPARNQTLEAAIRAGRVRRLLTSTDVADAYACMPFSSAIGWAFNESGTEAHNVVYEYDNNGIMFTQHFHFQFNGITEIPPQHSNNELMSRITETLRAYVSTSRPDVTGEYFDIVVSKMPWMYESELNTLAGRLDLDPDSVWSDLDARVVSRIGGGVGKGAGGRETVWWPGRFLAAPPFKVYEPLMDGIVNVSFAKLGLNQYDSLHLIPRVMDVLVHVYFIGNRLKSLRWYNDRSPSESGPVTETNDFDDCMYNGRWTWSKKSGGVSFPSNAFYLDNMNKPASEYSWEENGSILCTYDGVDRPGAGFDPVYPNRGDCGRTHRFFRRTITETRTPPPAYGVVAAHSFIMPGQVREGLLYGKNTVNSATPGMMRVTKEEYFREHDPHQYRITRCAYYGDVKAYHPPGYPTSEVMAWTDEDWQRVNMIWILGYQSLAKDCAGLYHREGRVYESVYVPTACNDIWDQGPWMDRCDVIPSSWYEQGVPLPETKIWVEGGGEIEYAYEVYADFPGLDEMTLVNREVWKPEGENIWPPWDATWGYPSPDEFGEVQGCWATFNCFGESDLVWGWAGPNAYGDGIFRGSPNREPFKGGFTPVGVVNGSV